MIILKKIDVHTHLIENICGLGSEGELRAIGQGKAQYASGKIIQLIPEIYGDRSLTIDVLLSVMNEHDVEYTVCLQGNYAGFQNLYTAEAMQAYPDKIIGAATYDPFFRNKNKIIEHLFQTLHFKVLKLETSNGSGFMANHDTILLDGKIMKEMFVVAEKYNLIVFIDIGRPGNNCYQVDELRKVALDFPNLKFVVCHLTAPQHQQMNILKSNLKKLNFSNIYFDIAALPNNTKQPYPFLEAQQYIREAIDIVGKDKILWGSDFPAAMNYCSYQDSYRYIEESDLLSSEEKKSILYENAHRLFKDLHQ